MRAFIAIKLPPEINASLIKLQHELKLTLPKISWVKPANLHLTLKFLGEISTEQLACAAQKIPEIIKGFSPFEIKLETLGVFPDLSRGRIIWIGSQTPDPELKRLVGEIEKELSKIGLPKERHSFQAHISLGRIKQPLNPLDLECCLKKVWNDCATLDLKFSAAGITLFKSQLNRQGADYSILQELNF